MKTNKFYWDINRVALFYLCHTAGTLAIIAALAILSGCIKKEEDEINDGPLANAESVADAESEAMEDRNMLDANIGDFVVYEVTAQPFNAPAQLLEYMTAQVMEKNDNGLTYELAVLRKKITPKEDGTDEIVEAMDRCKVYKDTGESTCLPANFEPSGSAVAALAGSNIQEFNNKLTTQSKEVTVHNFSSRVIVQDPPILVKNEPQCGNTPNCKLRTTYIEYDIIVRENGERQRYRIQRNFSTDAPAPGLETRFCQSSNRAINGRLIPVVLCYTLVNYKYGNRRESTLQDIKSAVSLANNHRSITDTRVGDETLRLNATRAGSNPYKLETLQIRTDSVVNNEVNAYSFLSDDNGNLLREGSVKCHIASTEADCEGYPLLDPSLKPHPNGLTKYYNLSVIEYKSSLPEAVRERRGCTETSLCPMTATMVRFQREDVINNIVLRTVHALEITPEAPVLNALSFRCSRMYSGVWPELVSIRSCAVLTDFLP